MFLNWKISFFEIVDHYDLYRFRANKRRNLVSHAQRCLGKEWGKVFGEPERKLISLVTV